ncbi:oligopeptide ABC transporter substrate-binding protein [Weissella paramesenteroides]|uniref:oligopeptide ABC transporter substrate-binding protein n=1 Tax=Weissella paramesenteroides TaxID=1249 RepID=UPI00103BB336|nr:oligopeptide ABC transporter substrate-binding protein [Weissella paramesenteroides]MDF8367669.1 oligopeptide ABC transporter substrate-binding protein [Weissella paramesenteroides]RZQ58883.1 oligopeptide ABC transporter substrate-binding protein [Weissella paramesenteroides]
MNKTSKKWAVSSAAVLAAVSLATFSIDNTTTVSAATKKAKLSDTFKNNAKESTKANNDSTLKVAEPNDSPFKGITEPTLSDNQEDSNVFAPGGNSTLFNVDNNFKVIDGGLANQKLDRQNNTVTITIRDNAKWSDGQPVVARDVEYPYEIIANPKSTSSQYSADFERIEGMADYHSGKASTISGFSYPDGENGKTVVIKYNALSPSMKFAGNSFIWGTVAPYHLYKGVAIDKLAASDQVRKNPVFVGPYKLDKVVEGESTSWSPNKYYWGKAPKIKHITINVVSSNSIDKAIQTKKYDFTTPAGVMRGTSYKNLKNLKNYKIVGHPDLGYNYFGFNVGEYDTKKQVNVMDPKSKMANKNLRQAMMYAINEDAINEKFGNGVKWRAKTLIPPIFDKYSDQSAKGFPYSPNKAAKLLDKAGYKKDGKWRTQPNGKKLVIYFGAMKGSSTSHATYQDYLQRWRKLGLNVKMATGKEMEMNSFYDTLQKPKQNKIDIFAAAWSLSSEPTPTQLYGADAPFNMGHFVTKKNTQLINDLNSDKAWDDKYRTDKFKEWQEYMNDQAAYVASDNSYQWVPVNKRVKGFDLSNGNNYFWNDLSLTSSKLK